ncbi:MAG: zf-HC2 domain-containing protein [Propionibacteriaceae bacterium]|jgi:hypothetical protein|nr:zf-HC2 domain-containing protein [Propionibacteriaceae bacterium]
MNPAAPPAARVTSLSDARLLGLARQSVRSALVELWRRHALYGLTVARGLAPDDDWEAISTRAWCLVIDPDNTDEADSGFRAYLYSVIRITSSLDQDVPGAEAFLTTAFRALTPRWREAAWNAHIELMSDEQSALVMGLTTTEIPAVIRQARQRLRQEWVKAHVSELDASSVCRWVWENSSSYLRGQLTVVEQQRVQSHLRRCRACRPALSDAIKVAAHLRTVVLPLIAGSAGAAALTEFIAGEGPNQRAATSPPVEASLALFARSASTDTEPQAQPDNAGTRPARSIPATAVLDDREDPVIAEHVAAFERAHTTQTPADSPKTRRRALAVTLGFIAGVIIVVVIILATQANRPAQYQQGPGSTPATRGINGGIVAAPARITAVDTGTANILIPIVIGTADPRTQVIVTVDGEAVTVTADDTGMWTTAALPAPEVGSRGQVTAVTVDPPAVALYEIAEPPLPAVEPSPDGLIVRLLGIASSQVDILIDGAVAATATLDAQGGATSQVAASPGGHFVQTRYAEQGRTGVISQATPITVG